MTSDARVHDLSPEAVPTSVGRTREPGPQRSRTFVALVVSAILPSSLVAAGLWAPQPSASMPAHIHEVTAAPQTLMLTCLDAQIDPFNAQHAQPLVPLILPARLGEYEGVRLQWKNEAGQKFEGQNKSLQAFTALSVAAQPGGDLRGLSLTPCVQPQTHHWFASGRTTSGEDTLIRVTNPSAAEAVITMRLWGAQGPIAAHEDVFTLPAGASITLRPGISAANQERLAVELETNGPAIGAWMLSSAMDGEVPQGAAWVTSTTPALSHTILGFSDGESTIRLANTTDKTTQVRVDWIVDTQRQLLPGGTVELGPGTITDLPLPQVAEGYAAAVVTSESQPIIAQGAVRHPGQEWPQGKKTWTSRTLLTPVSAVSEAALPPISLVQAQVERQAKNKPLRPTSVPTKSGLSVSGGSILVVNTHDAPTTVTLSNAEPVTVPAHSQVSIDIADVESVAKAQSTDEPVMLKAEHPVHIAIVLNAQTPSGDVDAVYPVMTPNLAHATVGMLSR